MDFERGLNNSRQWLSAATKTKAIEKLEAMTFYFGWPGDDELDRQGREFFRGFAYGWMENMSADEIENYKKDEHAANCLRVNGNVYLMDEFYRLFNCQDGKMYLAPKDRIEIW